MLRRRQSVRPTTDPPKQNDHQNKRGYNMSKEILTGHKEGGIA